MTQSTTFETCFVCGREAPKSELTYYEDHGDFECIDPRVCFVTFCESETGETPTEEEIDEAMKLTSLFDLLVGSGDEVTDLLVGEDAK